LALLQLFLGGRQRQNIIKHEVIDRDQEDGRQSALPAPHNQAIFETLEQMLMLPEGPTRPSWKLA